MNNASTPKRIVITNIVSLNTGDAAILWGMFQILRTKYGPDTQFVVFDKSAEAAGRYYPWANFRQALFGNPPRTPLGRKLEVRGYGHWNERVRFLILALATRLCRWRFGFLSRWLLRPEDYQSIVEYAHADLVVSTGGTYLTENYGLQTNIRDYRLTQAADKPLVFFTQTLGPFTRPEYRRAFTTILNYATSIFLRDERSREHVLDLGISQEKITLAKDAAFVIPSVAPLDLSAPLRLAISVRSMDFFSDGDNTLAERYKESVSAMAKLAVREYGAKIEFLSTCQGIEEYWNDDTKLADEIVSNLPEDVSESVSVDRQFRQPLDVVEAYRNFNLVIATRMHAAILSIVAGTPVLGIAYEFKLEELFYQLGMNEARLSTSDMDIESSGVALKNMLGDLEHWRGKVFEVKADCAKQAASVVGNLPDV